jgi:ribosomal protein L32
MEQNDDGDSRVDIFNLFLKWKDTPKNEQAPLAIRLKEKISDTIPESYEIKVEECSMRYFVLLTDSDFVNCKTQPFTCVYEFCQYLENFHKTQEGWYDTLLPHCLPGSNRQQWVAYNLYRFKFTWKQVCHRLMQKYDSPSRRPKIDKAVKETKFDSSQSIEKFNQVFNTHIDELFYDEQTAIKIYRTIIPNEYASMLSITIIIDDGARFIYTIADIQQRTADIINASENDFVCYSGISHTIYSAQSESSICCQDQHSISTCPDTFVLRWPNNDPRNKRNEPKENTKPISFLPKSTKTETNQTIPNVPSVVIPAPNLGVPPEESLVVSSSKPPPNLAPVSPSVPSPMVQSQSSSNQPPSSSVPKLKPTPISPPHKRQTSPSRTGERLPPKVKKSKKVIKCRNCGEDYGYGHNNVCPRRGGRSISRTG